MKRSLALAVCGFSLVLALVGGWLADRQFTAALDTLADQAVLQHQRNLFGYADTLQEVKADDSPHMILADDSGTRYVNASDKAFAGQLYFDRQRLIVGTVPCTFALLDQTGRVIYSKLPDTIPESELAALKDADTTTMRLCGQTLLLCDQVAGASGQRVWVWMVTALDTSSAYAVRTATLRQWFLLQAVLTLAALLMVHHTTALQQLNDRQSRFVADLTHELKTPLTSMIGYADLLRGGELPPENQRRAADAIYHESTRLESLSQQLLSLQDLRQEALTLTAVPAAAAFEDVASAVTASIDLSALQEGSVQMVKRLYGLNPSDFDGCLLYYPQTNMEAEELLLLKLRDTSQQEAVRAAVEARLETQKTSFDGYGLEQYDLLTNHSILDIRGNYVLFIVHKDAAAVQQAFRGAL